MFQPSSDILMTPSPSKTNEIQNISSGITSEPRSYRPQSEIQVKTSWFSRNRYSWLIVTVSLIAVAGILGTVGIAVVSFVVLRSTTPTTSTTTSTTTTSTTTNTMCFITPSPRPSDVWFLVGTMISVRVYHTSTLISQDNSVLIAGGSNGGAALISTEKYIPSTGCFQAMGNMPRTRYLHTADQLPSLSGYVLLAGGYGTGGSLAFADLFHPMTSNTLTISLSSARHEHKSVTLGSSTLVLIGGYNQATLLNSGDALNVGSNSSFSTATGTLSSACFALTVTQLGNASDIALVAGGTDGGSSFFSSAALYHGFTNTFLSLGSVSLSPGRAYHTATYLPPPIHKVLITGGAAYYVTYATMFLFDIATLSFSTLTSTMSSPRYLHTATLLPSGKVLLAGGYNAGSLKTCELIDPSNNYSSTPAGSLNTSRHYHTATLIPDNNNGTVLVCGGLNGAVYLNSCELYFV